MTSNPHALDRIDHIVVLMLENHSFDSLLGWLYGPGEESPHDESPEGQPRFEGLAWAEHSCPVSTAPGARRVAACRVDEAADPREPTKSLPNPDPGEGYDHTSVELFCTETPPDPPVANMEGFVIDYAQELSKDEAKGENPLGTKADAIMGCHTPKAVPVLSTLARSFAVCDHWYCSAPTQTWPNRRFVHAATCWGDVKNTPVVFKGKQTTLFDRLAAKGLSFRNYHQGVPLTGLLFPHLLLEHPLSFPAMSEFMDDCAKGTLPPYSFLEPSYTIHASDQLPPNPLAAGERLIAEVYEAVRSSPLWEKTLLIITYDEHGGSYDHVSPPLGAAPPDEYRGPDGFDFSRFGVRVPAVLVSAWIDAGVIYRSSTDVPIDHTSIIKTVRERFDLGGALTKRDEAAPSLASVLSRQSPRSADEVPRALAAMAGDVTEEDPQVASLSGFHEHIHGLAAAVGGEDQKPAPKVVGELHDFVVGVVEGLKGC